METKSSLQGAHDKHWKDREIDESSNFRRNVLVKKIFSNINNESRILDFACGNGDLTEYLVKSGFKNVYSVDFSDEGVEITRKRGGQNVLQADICEQLPYESEFFDYVLWLDNIEHLNSPQAAMDNIRRTLKSKGTLLLSLPNMGYWFYRLYYLKNGTIIGTDGVLPDGHINLPWEYQHIRFFNEKYIKIFLEKNGFEVVRISSYHNENELKNMLSKLYRRLFAEGFLVIAQKR